MASLTDGILPNKFCEHYIGFLADESGLSVSSKENDVLYVTEKMTDKVGPHEHYTGCAT